jgi:tetratricopeptide (TPR) repeat protein
MLALDQLGRLDEASAAFQKLVEQSGFKPDLLNSYFQFCVEHERKEDLAAMADKLNAVQDGEMEHFGAFFRAAALLPAGDKGKEKEALDLLASTRTGTPDFIFYAATQLYEHDRLDEAEEQYKSIQKTYRTPSLVYVNLSGIYHEKGEDQQAFEAAKEAYDLENESMIASFVYAKRLSEEKRYQEAVDALKFPRHAVNYREDIIELWVGCMYHVIEKSIADRKFLQAEEQCKHLLLIAPGNVFGQETLAKVRDILYHKDEERTGTAVSIPAT